MLRFGHPLYLYGLFIIPFLVLVYWFILNSRKRKLNAFAEKQMQTVLISSYSNLKRNLKFGLFLGALTFFLLGAAAPQVGMRMEEVKQTGIDVYILLDVSLSMQAQDIKPNRLEQAKYQISNLINRLRGDRIGLVVFAGEAYIQFPLTTDYSAANLFLSAVDFNTVPSQGTAIAAAINMAVKSFDYKASTRKAIVLITDGEDHEGDIDQAVSDAVSKNIQIFCIGVGSPEGVPIPVFNQKGEQVDYKKDSDGNTVLTKLDENILKEIASKGKGKYYRASNYDDHLQKIFDDLSKLEKTEYGVKKITDYDDIFYYFLAAGLILLLVEFFISERKMAAVEKLLRRVGI
jgi:Ca-activated chloride channel family protein